MIEINHAPSVSLHSKGRSSEPLIFNEIHTKKHLGVLTNGCNVNFFLPQNLTETHTHTHIVHIVAVLRQTLK